MSRMRQSQDPHRRPGHGGAGASALVHTHAAVQEHASWTTALLARHHRLMLPLPCGGPWPRSAMKSRCGSEDQRFAAGVLRAGRRRWREPVAVRCRRPRSHLQPMCASANTAVPSKQYRCRSHQTGVCRPAPMALAIRCASMPISRSIPVGATWNPQKNSPRSGDSRPLTSGVPDASVTHAAAGSASSRATVSRDTPNCRAADRCERLCTTTHSRIASLVAMSYTSLPPRLSTRRAPSVGLRGYGVAGFSRITWPAFTIFVLGSVPSSVCTTRAVDAMSRSP